MKKKKKTKTGLKSYGIVPFYPEESVVEAGLEPTVNELMSARPHSFHPLCTHTALPRAPESQPCAFHSERRPSVVINLAQPCRRASSHTKLRARPVLS